MRLYIFTLLIFTFPTISFSQETYLIDSFFSQTVFPLSTPFYEYYTYDDQDRLIFQDKTTSITTSDYSDPKYIINNITYKNWAATTVEYIEKDTTNNIHVISKKTTLDNVLIIHDIDSTYFNDFKQPIKRHFYSLTENGQLYLDYKYEWSYLSNGNISFESYKSFDENGELQRFNEYYYSYNSNQNIQTVQYVDVLENNIDSSFYFYKNGVLEHIELKEYENSELISCRNKIFSESGGANVEEFRMSTDCINFETTGISYYYLSDLPLIQYDSVIHQSFRDIDSLRAYQTFAYSSEYFNNENNIETNLLINAFSDKDEKTLEIVWHEYYHTKDNMVNTKEIEKLTGNLNIYPNPSVQNQALFIQYSKNVKRIIVTDQNGQVINSISANNSGSSQINAPQNSGTYFLSFINQENNIIKSKKLLVLPK